jgi:glycosyltransferase involved in cell wall biosynthesis
MHKAVLLQLDPKARQIEHADSGIYFSLVIPLFNEEESVAALIAAVQAALGDYQQPWELILVDDGSSDSTIAVARSALVDSPLRVSLVQLSRNYGQTAAMQAGIDRARGEYIVTMDGDLQNDPLDIPAMLAQLVERDLDLLVGWRRDRQDKLLARKIPSFLANKLIGRVSGVRLHDYGCSLKVYRAEVIKQVKLVGEMHRFIPIWVAGVVPVSRIGEMPVRHHARQFGTSKYGISRSVRVVLDLLSVMFFKRYLGRPGHFFGSIGLFIGLLGSLILSWLAVDKFILGNDIGTRPLLLAGVMGVLVSLQLITTGILAEMMSRTYLDSNKSNNYLIRNLHQQNAPAAVDASVEPTESVAITEARQ